MSEIIKFKSSKFQLLDNAIFKSSCGDYLQALDYINRALEFATDKDKCELSEFFCSAISVKAAIYEEMDLNKQALHQYFCLFNDSRRQTIFEGIIRCFVRLGMLEHAEYYISYAISNHIVIDGEFSEFLESLVAGLVRHEIPDSTDLFEYGELCNLDEKIVEDAKEQLRQGNIEKGIKLLHSIRSHSDSYAEACCLIAFVHLENKEYERASLQLRELTESKYKDANFEYSKKDLFYLITKSQESYFLDQFEQVDHYCDIIDRLQFSDYRDIKRILTNVKTLKKHKLVYKYSLMLEETVPFNIQNLYSIAISAFNIGNYEVARAKFFALYTIDTTNLIAKVYGEIALMRSLQGLGVGSLVQKKLALSLVEIDYDDPYVQSIFEEHIETVQSILKNKRVAKSKMLFQHRDTVEWLLFFNPIWDLAYDVAFVVSDRFEWEWLVSKFLVSFDTDVKLKFFLLNFYLNINIDMFFKKTNKTYAINVNINSYLIEVFPICPKLLKNMDSSYCHAYWEVYCVLLFYYGVEPFDKKLYAKFEKFAKTFEPVQSEYNDEFAICACFAYHYGEIPLFSSAQKCIVQFGADSELFLKYNSYLSSQEKFLIANIKTQKLKSAKKVGNSKIEKTD